MCFSLIWPDRCPNQHYNVFQVASVLHRAQQVSVDFGADQLERIVLDRCAFLHEGPIQLQFARGSCAEQCAIVGASFRRTCFGRGWFDADWRCVSLGCTNTARM